MNFYNQTLLFILFFSAPLVLAAQDIDYRGFPEWSLQKKDSTEYALYTPSNLQPEKKYPIALFLHGCCGESYKASLRNVVDAPVRMWHQFGKNKQDIPTYIIAPATSRGWTQHFINLKSVIDDLVANHNGDAQRIYICGFSMGANGTYKFIQKYPGYFAAAFTIGSDFSGDSVLLKNIPLWMNQGETDWFSRKMQKQVASLRILNGMTTDTGNTWVTGVNPRYTNFKGEGHVAQWPAVSKQDATGWAYSKVNDGNNYPVVFFSPSQYPLTVSGTNPIQLIINASDPDGSISKVEVFLNGALLKTFSNEPYIISIIPKEGDNKVEAIAYDNAGKQSKAVTRAKVNIGTTFNTVSIPFATAGKYYETQLTAKGNGQLNYSLKNGAQLPAGLLLYPNGIIKGVTAESGRFSFDVLLKDEDEDCSQRTFTLIVKKKDPGTVLVYNINTASGSKYRISKVMPGETPYIDNKETILSTNLKEVNFSNVGMYNGLSFIQTDINDADTVVTDFLSFDIDEEAIIYVAYEKFDHDKKSTAPEWLNSFSKMKEEIVAQYKYFNVYSKRYKKGKIILPSAGDKNNGVGGNYFVMIKQQ